MNRTTLLVAYFVSTAVVMALLLMFVRWFQGYFGSWALLTLVPLMVFAAWLIDRHEQKQGTLPPPGGALDRWYRRRFLRAPTEDLQRGNPAPHNRLDRPE